jgi:MoxR-like ATPase
MSLIEDVPGVGKTMLARSIAISFGQQLQAAAMHARLVAQRRELASRSTIKTGEFEFRPGPTFVNILLADEVNRATPRTQSALLEAMGEYQVTVDGVTRPLPRPFLVLATQNPIEYEGTFPLPEAQLDRFLMRISLGYPPTTRCSRFCQSAANSPSRVSPSEEGKEMVTIQQDIWM